MAKRNIRARKSFFRTDCSNLPQCSDSTTDMYLILRSNHNQNFFFYSNLVVALFRHGIGATTCSVKAPKTEYFSQSLGLDNVLSSTYPNLCDSDFYYSSVHDPHHLKLETESARCRNRTLELRITQITCFLTSDHSSVRPHWRCWATRIKNFINCDYCKQCTQQRVVEQ